MGFLLCCADQYFCSYLSPRTHKMHQMGVVDMDFYTRSVRETLAELGVDGVRGLSKKEAGKRYQQYGANRLEGKRGKPFLLKFLEQFSDFMVLILLGAAGLSFLASVWEGQADFVDPIIILAIVLLNATMGLVQEARAERAIQSLQALSAPKTRVVRDGAEVTVDSDTVVPGDVLLFETGDAVTADARLIESVGLRVEESSLTGESTPVVKDHGARSVTGAPLGERRNMVFSGSTVVAGRCRGIAVATGMGTEVGQIARLLDHAETPQTPLQRRLGDTGKTMGAFALLICSFIFMLGVIQRTDLLDSFMLAVSLAVAAVPEGLPAIVTIVLALGVQRLARRSAIVRKLPAVETLGSATVICSDKTGTLTQNRMTVQQVVPVTGEHDRGMRQKLLLYGSLCTNTRITGKEVQGDPTERAIVEAAIREGLDLRQAQSRYPRRGEVPFDSGRKRMSTLHQVSRGELCSPALSGRLAAAGEQSSPLQSARGGLLIVKGAPDVLLGLCEQVASAGGTMALTDGKRREILGQNAQMANRALRVIAVAYRENVGTGSSRSQSSASHTHVGTGFHPRPQSPGTHVGTTALGRPWSSTYGMNDTDRTYGTDGTGGMTPPLRGSTRWESADDRGRSSLRGDAVTENAEQNLTFLGLIAMQDPPRPEARGAVLTCRRAGIRPVMITGDHAATASAIARELGILTGNRGVLTGTELDALSDRDLQEAVKHTAVFARVSPLHKSRVVEAFQANGEIVAMTGDGVNDAPALKISDIGCAMGKTGTDVARDASDMILTDDNFATIVSAVREGRGIYQNMVKSVHFLLSCNVGEILTILIAVLIGMPPPLLPIQLLWVNLVTDSFPALALGAEKAERDIMDRPPVSPKSSMFSGGLGIDILFQGMMIGGLSLWAFFLGVQSGDYTTGRTFAFAVLALSQLVHACNVRSRESLFKIGFFSNGKMVLALLFCATMQVAVIGHPTLAGVFGVAPLTFAQWRTVLLLVPIPLVVVELTKLLRKGEVSARAQL